MPYSASTESDPKMLPTAEKTPKTRKKDQNGNDPYLGTRSRTIALKNKLTMRTRQRPPEGVSNPPNVLIGTACASLQDQPGSRSHVYL